MARQVLFLNRIVALSLVIASCQEEIRTLDESQVIVKTKQGITLVNGSVFTGTLISRYEFGNTMHIKSYKNGREHGTWKKFYPNNRIAEVREFNNGQKAGICKSWWENGTMRSEYNFKDDEYDGLSREWSASGLLIKKMNYKNGYETGLQQLWDDDGSIRANYVAKNGRNYGLTGVKSCATTWTGDSIRVH